VAGYITAAKNTWTDRVRKEEYVMRDGNMRQERVVEIHMGGCLAFSEGDGDMYGIDRYVGRQARRSRRGKKQMRKGSEGGKGRVAGAEG